MSRVAGQATTSKRITGSTDIRLADIFTAYSEGTYNSGKYSEWPPPLTGSGISGGKR